MKLLKGTLSNIPEGELRELLGFLSRSETHHTREYVRDYVVKTLEESGNSTLSLEDFQGLKDDISSQEKLIYIANSCRKPIDIRTIKFLSQVQYDEDFGISELREIIIFSNEDTLKYIVAEVCETPELFYKLYSSKEVRSSLQSAKKENIELLYTQVCTSTEDFISLCQIEAVRKMFWGFEERRENMKLLLPLCSGVEDVKRIFSHENLEDLTSYSDVSRLKYFIDAVSLTSFDELMSVLDEQVLCRIIKHETSDKFQYMLDTCGISGVSDLLPLAGEGGFIDKLIKGNNDTLEYVFHLLNKKSPQEKVQFFNDFPQVLIALSKSQKEILEFFIQYFHLDGIEALQSLTDSENVQDVLQFGSMENIVQMFDFYEISSLETLKELCKNDLFTGSLTKEVPTANITTLINFCETKEFYSLFLKYDSFAYILLEGIPESITLLVENGNVSKDDFFAFYNKFVAPSRDNARIILQNKIPYSSEFGEIFQYFLGHKKKSLVSFIDKLSTSYEFSLGIDISYFRPLESFTIDSEVDFDELERIYVKMLSIVGSSGKQEGKLKTKFSNAKNAKNLQLLQEMLADISVSYFERLYNKKWENKLHRELGISGEIDSQKLANPDFIEAYKMSVQPKYNKEQIQKLLSDYLTGAYDDISELNQYKTPKNQAWLKENLSEVQQDIWLGENAEIIDVGGEDTSHNMSEDISEQRIEHHMSVALIKIQEINALGFSFDTHFKNSGELQKHFNVEIKKKEADIKVKDKENVYEDLKLQIDAIKRLKQSKGKIVLQKTQKVTIQRERDPIKSLMMGNWVQGSCLSFYSSVGNYWSAISNTVDANKGVYYIRDEQGDLLGRCILTIGSDKKLTRYPMYYAKESQVDIDTLFNEYTRKLGVKLGLELNGNQYSVDDIEGEKWYKDGEVSI